MVRKNRVLAACFALLVTAGLWAQQSQSSSDPNQKPSSEQMSMGEMMKSCQKHCSASRESISKIRGEVDAALQSNDPARMRAALQQVQKPLAEMDDHMSMCMKMMSDMHGDMDHKSMDMDGMMSGKTKKEQRQKPPSEPPK